MSADGRRAADLALAGLYAKRPQVIKPGLDRIEAALRHLGPEPLLAHPTVLVGGTNGKGTTTGLLWRLLAGLGVRTGLFTSPHLVRFAERIQTSHAPVDDALLLQELAALQADLPPALWEPLSFFEVTTLLGLRLFRRLGTDVDLLEVGLGGRWDSTNATRPLLSVVASIGLDHTELLGGTTAAIAGEKAGIMRTGRPTLWGGAQAGDLAAAQALARAAEACAAPFWQAGREFGATTAGVWARLPGCAFAQAPWPACAAAWPGFLRANFQLAFAGLVWLLHAPELAAVWLRLGTPAPAAAAATAVARLDAADSPVPPSMRARFELVTVPGPHGRPRQLLLDVCHNVDGAQALVRGLRETGLLHGAGTIPGYVSILSDKDHAGVLGVLRSALAPVALFASGSERSWNAAQIGADHKDLPFYGSFRAAWDAGLAPGVDGPAVVCGSVHAVGEVCAALGLATL